MLRGTHSETRWPTSAGSPQRLRRSVNAGYQVSSSEMLEQSLMRPASAGSPKHRLRRSLSAGESGFERVESQPNLLQLTSVDSPNRSTPNLRINVESPKKPTPERTIRRPTSAGSPKHGLRRPLSDPCLREHQQVAVRRCAPDSLYAKLSRKSIEKLEDTVDNTGRIIRAFRRALIKRYRTLPNAIEALAKMTCNVDIRHPGRISLTRWLRQAEGEALNHIRTWSRQDAVGDLVVDIKDLLKICSLVAPRKPLSAFRASAAIYDGSGYGQSVHLSPMWQKVFSPVCSVDEEFFVHCLGEWDVHPRDAATYFHSFLCTSDLQLQSHEFHAAIRRSVPGPTLEEIAVRLALEDARSPLHGGRVSLLEEVLRTCSAYSDSAFGPGMLHRPDWLEWRHLFERLGMDKHESRWLYNKFGERLMRLKNEHVVVRPDPFSTFFDGIDGADPAMELQCNHVLHVRWPHLPADFVKHSEDRKDLRKICGDYAVVQGRTVNGYPLWKKTDADFFVYSASIDLSGQPKQTTTNQFGEYWGIADELVWDRKFKRYKSCSFFVRCVHPHTGTMPQNQHRWEYAATLSQGDHSGTPSVNNQKHSQGVRQICWRSDSSFRLRIQGDDPPLKQLYVLRIYSRVPKINGDYALIQKETVNTYPVWKKTDADVYLYSAFISSTMNGLGKQKQVGEYWGIGDCDAKANGFQSSNFFVCCNLPHFGNMPQDVRGDSWEYFDGSSWGDASMKVVAHNVYSHELFPHIVTSPWGRLVANRPVLAPGESITIHYDFATSLLKNTESQPFMVLVPSEMQWNQSGGTGYEWLGERGGKRSREHYWHSDGVQRVVINTQQHKEKMLTGYCTGVAEMIVPELLHKDMTMMTRRMAADIISTAFCDTYPPSVLAGYNMAPQALHFTDAYQIEYEISLEVRLYASQDGLRPARLEPILPALRFRVSQGATSPPMPTPELCSSSASETPFVEMLLKSRLTSKVALRAGSFACYDESNGLTKPPLVTLRACVPLRHRRPNRDVRFIPFISSWWVTHVPRSVETGLLNYSQAQRRELHGSEVAVKLPLDWVNGSGQTWLQAVRVARQNFWGPVSLLAHGWMNEKCAWKSGRISGLSRHYDAAWEEHAAAACPSSPVLCPKQDGYTSNRQSYMLNKLAVVEMLHALNRIEVRWPYVACTDLVVSWENSGEKVFVKPGTSIRISPPYQGQQNLLNFELAEVQVGSASIEVKCPTFRDLILSCEHSGQQVCLTPGNSTFFDPPAHGQRYRIKVEARESHRSVHFRRFLLLWGDSGNGIDPKEMLSSLLSGLTELDSTKCQELFDALEAIGAP